MPGNRPTARAAAAFLEPTDTKPAFGVFWFTTRLDTDNEAGTSTLRDNVHRQASNGTGSRATTAGRILRRTAVRAEA